MHNSPQLWRANVATIPPQQLTDREPPIYSNPIEPCALQDGVDALRYVGRHVAPSAALIPVLCPNLQAKLIQPLYIMRRALEELIKPKVKGLLPGFVYRINQKSFTLFGGKLRVEIRSMYWTHIAWWACGGIQPPFSSSSAAWIACDLSYITSMLSYGVMCCLKFRKKNNHDSLDSDSTMANATGNL
ncbi:hypothetical protein PIB30_011749 [Stylosanthes scabra]|uniref:Uncharacterized protein n=1 Tax=Stylosanthes scabra TaxID=79078 RepID=A0ABU6Z4I4_9FABA|nr:hypothetical protein [Stylosanthes scabra]